MIPLWAAAFVSPDGEVHWERGLERQCHEALAEAILAKLEPGKAQGHVCSAVEVLLQRGWARVAPGAGTCSYRAPLTDAQRRAIEELFRAVGPPTVIYEHLPTGRYTKAYTWEPKRWEQRCPTCDGKLRPNLETGRDFYCDTCRRPVAYREAVMLAVPLSAGTHETEGHTGTREGVR